MVELQATMIGSERTSTFRLAIGKIALWLLVFSVFAALYLPVIMIGLISVFRVRRGQFLWDTFSLDAFGKITGNAQLMSALTNSLVVGAFASLVAVGLATALAFQLLSRPGKLRRLVEFLIYLPFVMPPIVTGLSLLITLREAGIERGLVAVTAGHVIFVLAIAYSTISARLKSLSPSLVHASLDLGATRMQTMRYVVLPQLAPALMTAAVLTFALSLDETIISLFLVGDTTTLPIRLYSLMRVGLSPEVNALVTVILIVTIILAFVSQGILRRSTMGSD